MGHRMKKLLSRVEVLIAISSVVFGLVASQLLDKIIAPIFDTTTRSLLMGILFLAILVVISIVTLGVFTNRYDKSLGRINDEILSVNQRLGLTVQFIRDPPQHSAGKFYQLAFEIIEKAQHEIIVLYSAQSVYSTVRAGAEKIETAEYKNEREKYWQALLNKLEQNQGKAHFYRRVIQFPEGIDAKITVDRVGPRQLAHFKAVLDILKEYPDAGYIKKAPLFLDQTFVVVDRRYVVWGIDSIDPDVGIRYVEGALFFEDPHQEFIQYLVGFFQRVDSHAVIVKKLPEE